MKIYFHLATLLSVTAIVPLHAEEAAPPTRKVEAVDPCVSVSQHVVTRVTEDPTRLLEIVSNEVAANSSCSCEVVKAAIGQSKADAKTVAAIVEAAILAAPEQMRMSAQCAIAVAPDAVAEVQAVVARLDPPSDEKAGSSSTSAKDLIEPAKAPNPLDFPGQGPIGPSIGRIGGIPTIIIIPPIIYPPLSSKVNP